MRVSISQHFQAETDLARGDRWTLSRLLAPYGIDEFRNSYWGKKPLLITRETPGFYADLFCLDDLERYLGQSGIFRRHVITTPEAGSGVPLQPPASLTQLAHRLADGGSMRIRSLEEFLDPTEPVVGLVRDIERNIAHPLASLSAYVSPKGGRGLGPHHDNSEVFTLQLTGQKTWHLFGHVSASESGTHRAADLGDPIAEITLSAGDLLFCPAGWVHDVTSEESLSFSLTMVFEPYRGLSIVELLNARLSASPAFLATLPANLEGPEFEARFDDLKRLTQDALDEVLAKDLTTALRTALVSGVPEQSEQRLATALSIAELDDTTRLVRDPGQNYLITKEAETLLVKVSGGHRFRLPTRAEGALHVLLAAETPVNLAQLSGLDGPLRLQLGRSLLLSGLIRTLPK